MFLEDIFGPGAGVGAGVGAVQDPFSLNAITGLLSEIFTPRDPTDFAAITVPQPMGVTVSSPQTMAMPAPAPVQAAPPMAAPRMAEMPSAEQMRGPMPMGPNFDPSPARGSVPPSPRPQEMPQAEEPRFWDRFNAFAQAEDRGGVLAGLAAAFGGVDDAKKHQNETVKMLMTRAGLDAPTAQVVARNPEMLKQLLPQMFGSKTQAIGPGQVLIDSAGKVLFDNSEAARPTPLPAGWARTPDGGMVPISGGPADPNYLREANASKEKPKSFAPKDLRDMSNDAALYKFQKQALGTFKPEYAGYIAPGLGDINQWAGRNLPGTTAEKKSEAQWWQDYRRNSELIERHGLFGAALTPMELASWRSADIAPDMQPETIQNNLATRQRITEEKMRGFANGLIQQGYDPAPIAGAFGLDLNELGVSTERQRGATNIEGPKAQQPEAPPSFSVGGKIGLDGIQKLPEGAVIRDGQGRRFRIQGGQPVAVQ